MTSPAWKRTLLTCFDVKERPSDSSSTVAPKILHGGARNDLQMVKPKYHRPYSKIYSCRYCTDPRWKEKQGPGETGVGGGQSAPVGVSYMKCSMRHDSLCARRLDALLNGADTPESAGEDPSDFCCRCGESLNGEGGDYVLSECAYCDGSAHYYGCIRQNLPCRKSPPDHEPGRLPTPGRPALGRCCHCTELLPEMGNHASNV